MAISVGMVGLGQFGRAFVHSFKRHPDVARLALCDMHPQRLADMAREHGIHECYSSLDDICRSDIQALVLITQPWLHYRQVMQALEAGKHVYSAVPTVYGAEGDALLEQCDRLVEAVTRTGLTYMLGETTFFRRETIYCRQKVREGAFGQLTYGECEYWHDIDLPVSNLREVARARRLSCQRSKGPHHPASAGGKGKRMEACAG